MTSPMFLGSARPITEPRTMPPDVALAYRRYVESHFGVIDVSELVEVMYRAGGRHAVEATTVFTDILPSLRRIEYRIHALADALEAALA